MVLFVHLLGLILIGVGGIMLLVSLFPFADMTRTASFWIFIIGIVLFMGTYKLVNEKKPEFIDDIRHTRINLAKSDNDKYFFDV